MITITPLNNIVQRPRWHRATLTGFSLLLALGVQAGVVWDGGGINSNINTPENWDDDINPPTDNTATLTFATGGTNATVNVSGLLFSSVILNADGDFTVDRASAANSFSYLPGGIAAGIPGTTPHTYTVWPNINFYTNNGIVTVTNNGVPGGTTLRLYGAFLSNSTNTISLRGDGTVIMCSKTGGGQMGPLYVDGGGLLVLEKQSEDTGNHIGSNGLLIRNGRAQLAGAGSDMILDNTGRVTATNAGQFDINGHSEVLRGITISGTGGDGGGALINSSDSPSSITLGSAGLAVVGNASIGGKGDITISGAMYTSSTYTLTKLGTNVLTLTGEQNSTLNNMLINAGTVALNVGAGWKAAGTRVTANNGGSLVWRNSEQFEDLLGIAASTNGGVADINGCAETLRILYLGGTGTNGTGAFINSSSTPSTITGRDTGGVYLTADASIGGTGDITINGPVGGYFNVFNKVGPNVLTLTGPVSSIHTMVTGGTLAFSGNSAFAQSSGTLVGVGDGATLDVAGLNSPPFLLGANQTLTNSASSTGIINGSFDASVGIVSISYVAGQPSLTIANGTLTLGAGTVFKVNNTGAQLGAGTYKLISKTAGGAVGGTVPSSVTVSGAGSAAPAAMQINNGELELVVAQPNPASITVTMSGSEMVLDWPAGQSWQLQAQTNGITGTWYPVSGATPPWTNNVDPANASVLYRLQN